jgi:filamentous hemagglutinin family protein
MKQLITLNLMLALVIVIADGVNAQNTIVPDGTLGSESSIVQPLFDGADFDGITGGATRGDGLFHSFSQFNVGSGLNAYFLTNPDVRNIFVRVTGNERSTILGQLGTRNGQVGSLSPSSASLFFLNPNGIVFGPQGRLDVAGSFIGTTASSFRFPDGREFSAINPQAAPILNVSTPLGLQFGQTVEPIELNGARLFVGDQAKNIALMGGEVRFGTNSLVYSPTGRIDVGAVSRNEVVEIGLQEGEWAFDYTSVNTFQDIMVENTRVFSRSDTIDKVANIFIYGKDIIFKNGPGVATSVQGTQVGGNIFIQARGKLSLQTQPGQRRANISTNNESNGRSAGSNLQINAAALELQASSIDTATFGAGRAGNLNIFVDGDILLSGEFPFRSSSGRIVGFPSQISSIIVDADAASATGNISIRARNLNLLNGGQIILNDGQIISPVSDRADIQGRIDIQLSDRAVFSGATSEGSPSGLFNEQFQAQNLDPNFGPDIGIRFSARSLLLDRGAQISTKSLFDGNARSIEINVTDEIILQGSRLLRSSSGRSTIIASGIISEKLNGLGNSGSININTGTLKVLNGTSINSQLSRTDFSELGFPATPNGITQGQSGNIKIVASQAVIVDGDADNPIDLRLPGSTNIYTPSRIDSSLGSSANGQGGNISIQAGNVNVTNGGQILTSNISAQGNAGGIEIVADQLLVAGTGQETDPDIFNVSRIASETRFTDRGDGGKIQIRARQVDLINGGSILTSNIGSIGNAGRVSVIGNEVNIVGQSQQNFPSGIFSNVSSPNSFIREEVQLSIDTFDFYKFTLPIEAIGNGGKIEVKARNLNILEGGEISARNSGQGNSGVIDIQATDRINLSDANIRTTSEKTAGGSISLASQGILLQGSSDIQTQVFSGIGNGGNIDLSANWIVLLDDSDILAFAKDGRGGNIQFSTRAFFAENYKPRFVADPQTLLNNGQVDINASGAVSGVISFPDSSYVQNSLNPLNQNVIDPNQLIAKTCIRRNRNSQGSLYVLGAGGLPDRPGDLRMTQYPTGDVQEIMPSRPPAPNNGGAKPWQKGDPIVEPQGAYQLANGEWILAQECGV